MDGGDSVYLQYSPERVFIFRRQNNLFALQAVATIVTWKHTRTHYCAVTDYIIAHIKLIARPRCRLQQNQKKKKVPLRSANRPDALPRTPPHALSDLFAAVLRHDSDSSAASFTATVMLPSVDKYKSRSDT